MIYIGIDPGKSGGLVAIGDRDILIGKMPATEHDIAAVFDRITCLSTETGTCMIAYIEKVHSMPKQGVTATFTFGMNYGFLRGVMVAYGIPFEEVTPQKWMGYFSIKRKKDEPKTAFKRRLLGKAQNLFPHVNGLTLATADALLIAEYCRRTTGYNNTT